MSRKLFVIAMACAMSATAPAWAAPGDAAAKGQAKKQELGSSCQGYSSSVLKSACKNDHDDNGVGKGHCKGVGQGHDKGRGKGHDKDQDCPVSS
jgi:hypothetical protein